MRKKWKIEKNIKIFKRIVNKDIWHECCHRIYSFPLVQINGVYFYFVLRESVLIIIGVTIGCLLAMAFRFSFPKSFVSLPTL